MVPESGLSSPCKQAQQGGFAAAVGADEADAHSVGDDEVQIGEQRALIVEAIGEAFDFDEALALASGAGEIEIGAGGAGAGAQIAEFADEFVGAVDARLWTCRGAPWGRGAATRFPCGRGFRELPDGAPGRASTPL